METKRDFIKTISIIDGNLSHIEETKRINGTLLIEIERVMEAYHQHKLKELLPSDEEILKIKTDAYDFHLQNMNGREDFEEAFLKGIEAASIEHEDWLKNKLTQ